MAPRSRRAAWAVVGSIVVGFALIFLACLAWPARLPFPQYWPLLPLLAGCLGAGYGFGYLQAWVHD